MHAASKSRSALARLIAAAVALLLVTAPTPPALAQPVDVPAATLTEVDVPGTSPMRSAAIDLDDVGYVETEYYASGTAGRYRGAQPGLMDTAELIDDGYPYRTRVLVRRPADPRDFNGTVVLEWSNVTVGQDINFTFAESYEYLLREGYAYASVSAQVVGVEALRAWSPERYGDLSVTADNTDPLTGDPIDIPTSPADAGAEDPPVDPLSWDITSQVGQSLLNSDEVFGGADVENIIVAGESQSAGRLTTYYNTIHPLHRVFDAIVYYDGARQLRSDVDTPALSVGSEWRANRFPSRFTDSQYFRIYEVAGTSHVSLQGMDYVDRQILREESLVGPDGPISLTDAITGCVYDNHWSAVDTGLVLNATFEAAREWVVAGTQAPASQFFHRGSDDRPVYDGDGRVIGGIQLPEFVAPTHENLAVNEGPGFCTLTGFHRELSASELEDLYGSHGAYVSKVTRTASSLARAGYMLTDDARIVTRDAARSDVAR